MKFAVSQEALLQGVSKVAGIIPTRTTLPSLYNIQAVLSGGKLRLTASDGDIFVITEVQVETLEEGSMLVPAQPLLNLLRELPGADLDLETTQEQHLVVNTAKGRFTIPGEDPSNFPPAPEERPPHKLTFSAEDFRKILNQTTFAVSHDELRPALTGLLFHIKVNELRAVSTDGHRLVKLVKTGFDTGAQTAGELEVIAPLRSLNLLSKHLASDDVQIVDVFLAPNRMVFDTGQMVITSKVVEGKFPAYDAVIPKNNSLVLIADVETLSAAVRRVSIFSSQLSRLVVLQLSSNQIKLSAEDPDSGRHAQEEIDAKYEGEPFDIGYNANYLLESLRHLDSKEVEIRLGSPTTAGIFKPLESREDEDLLLLLMPIRLQ